MHQNGTSFVPAIQRTLNSMISRSTQMTPFQLLTGVKEAKRNILMMQEENCQNFNKKRKKVYQYEIGDIVAIQRTQFGTALKLRPKFFGPYEVVKVKPKDRYDVRKIGLNEGPNTTSTAGDHMKMWGEAILLGSPWEKKNQVLQRTVYGQAGRCGVVTQLNLTTKDKTTCSLRGQAELI
ncbi:transposon Tf2-9 polyprotein [Trichonephila clavipes]|nr:transposon Tf2-9 polyprotein [Trichonephila clavipes]